MRAFFWVLALFALAVGLVVSARYNEGYVLLVVPPYRAEVSLNLLLVVVLAAFVLFFSIIRLITTAVVLPSRVREYRLARRRQAAHAALLAALEAYFEGRYAKAEQAAVQAASLDEHRRLSLVVAARAAHELRAYERRDAFLKRAGENAADDDVLRRVTEAELLLDERRPREALEALQGLPRKHTAALRLELKAQQQMRHWTEVAALLTELERRSVFAPEQASKLRTHALAESIRRKTLDVHALDELWRKVPEADRRSTPVAAAAAEAYLALGRRKEARQVIEQSLEAAWASELVALYPECADADIVRQIERAESWLEEHPGDAVLLLALGRLCARQGLWGKAESYLEASVSVDSTYAGHVELARLHEKLGNADGARRHYRESLELALLALEGSGTARALPPPDVRAKVDRGAIDPLEVEQRR